jgi:hypothetical protein
MQAFWMSFIRKSSWIAACILIGLGGCTEEVAPDKDGDGYDASVDCNDNDANVRPNIGEKCNSIDDNCDGQIDEVGAFYAPIWYPDGDGDDFGDSSLAIQQCTQPEGYIEVGGDCDDTDRSIRPDAEEDCDEIDNNCNGVIDADADTADTWYEDADGDGAGNPDVSEVTCTPDEGWVTNKDDCDDEDATLNPDTIWYADEDGDGLGDSETSVTRCIQPGGYVDNGDDCDDANSNITTGSWYSDLDLDGYGMDLIAENTCEQPLDSVAVGGDCDDLNDQVHPDQEDGCDDVDNDCDGSIDEDCVE